MIPMRDTARSSRASAPFAWNRHCLPGRDSSGSCIDCSAAGRGLIALVRARVAPYDAVALAAWACRGATDDPEMVVNGQVSETLARTAEDGG
jgi:hypothetical protein